MKKQGLRPGNHSELNHPDVAPDRYDELRKEYAGNKWAQRQIDIYDPSSQYHPKLKEYIEALKSGDVKREKELDKWFREQGY